MKTKTFLIFLTVMLFTFFACTKMKNLIESSSSDLADDDAVTQVALDDVSNTTDYAISIMENLPGTIKGDAVVLADSCPTISITNPTNGVFPKTITINYGSGCTGYYSSTRAGKIIIVVTDKRSVVGATRTVTFDNYYFNGIKIEGTKVFTTMPLHNQNPVFSVKLTGGKFTLTNGKTIERTVDHQREWIAGYASVRNIWDDEYLITGTATGKGINGNTYTNTILTALDWKRTCEFIVSGSVKIKRSGVEPIVLDYGTGACDAIATLSRGDHKKEITLRHKYRTMP